MCGLPTCQQWLEPIILAALQVFMALKIGALCLAAVQVKAGYPSVQESMAAGSGQGRHSFYFYRHVDERHWVLFQVSLQPLRCCHVLAVSAVWLRLPPWDVPNDALESM